MSNSLRLSLKHYILFVIVTLGALVVTLSCTVSISFSGASIPVEAKTVSVAFFPNIAPLVSPSLSNILTESLKDKFIRETSLSLVPEDGDLAFSGEITGYSTAVAALSNGDVATNTRLTIEIKVTYVGKYDKKFNFSKSFTQYADYPASENLATVESSLNQEIVDKLVQDIFNASVANW